MRQQWREWLTGALRPWLCVVVHRPAVARCLDVCVCVLEWGGVDAAAAVGVTDWSAVPMAVRCCA